MYLMWLGIHLQSRIAVSEVTMGYQAINEAW
jgi:hypothetical protein